ncbi:DUF4236 domain-containing protein [Marinobacter halophilus]|uniref:DUF4236 domain-containing protein n=1 Tax=Marinobacter halophilus TaxID=1323740 RepID=A0A2T1KFY5_9GAMM|nr:hypothetical protein C7H08_06395 [Marinobacter halophilus]
MAFRFRRTVKIFPGVRLNLGKRGVSVPQGFAAPMSRWDDRGYTATWYPVSRDQSDEYLAYRRD